MSYERGMVPISRERLVDRPATCYSLVPESVEAILGRIQILSFEGSAGGQHNAAKPFPLPPSSPNENRKTA